MQESSQPFDEETPQGILKPPCNMMERMWTERELRLIEEKLRLVIQGTNDGIWDWHIGTRHNFTSRRWKEILGYREGEFPDTDAMFFESLHPDDRPVVQEALRRHLEEDAPYNVEIRLRHKDGSYRWCLTQGEAVRDAQGQPVRMVGSLTDITLRKQAEEQLRQSETFINSVVEHLPNMVFVKEASDLCFVRFNKAGEELLGYRRDTLLGKNDYDFFPKEEADFFTAKDREVLSSGRLLDIPEEVIHTVNGPRILRTQKVPIFDAGGNPQYLLGISEDITERKRMEAQHEQISQDLHDNILQSLYAVGMQLEVSRLVIGKNPRKSKDHITRAIKQLNHLVMDVREFITLLQRRTVPKLDFGQALRQLASSFSTIAWDAPDIVIETPAVSALAPEQSKQLLSIAREALSNSQRHAQATRRWIRFDKAIETIRLEIGDDGIGFDPKQCRRRGHGLFNMAARAKNISARFTLDSAPSRGTRITVAIPLKGKSENETRSARRRARP